MPISFAWLYMFKCDVYAQELVDQTQKDFWVFYMFLKVILYFCVFSFGQNAFCVFFIKIWFRGCFARSSRLRASREKCLRELIFSLCHTKTLATVSQLFRDQQLLAKCCLVKTGIFQNSDRGYRNCIATVSRPKASRESFCASVAIFATVSLLSNSWKTHVFSFI